MPSRMDGEEVDEPEEVKEEREPERPESFTSLASFPSFFFRSSALISSQLRRTSAAVLARFSPKT